MRMVILDCHISYSGRGETTLERGERLLLWKSDGAVSIHQDAGNKPVNYMAAGSLFSETLNEDGDLVWSFETSKERLTLTIYTILDDINVAMAEDKETLQRDGTEDHVQQWIALHPHLLAEGYTEATREVNTGVGAVDIVLRGKGMPLLVVEVKRTAMLGAVSQVGRYVDAFREIYPDEEIVGCIAALDIRPKTFALASKRGFRCITLPEDWKSIA